MELRGGGGRAPHRGAYVTELGVLAIEIKIPMPELGTWAHLFFGTKPLLSLACLWQLWMLGSRPPDPTPKLVISATTLPNKADRRSSKQYSYKFPKPNLKHLF
jgi:hypothetical protein